MSTQLYMTGLGATQISVGLSQVIRFKMGDYQTVSAIKILSGGSLEVVPPQFSGSSTAAGNAWTKGYLVGASEVIAINGPAVFYLAASGSTVVVQALVGYTAGVTLP